MRPTAKSIPVDSTIEFLEEKDYIKSNTDGTYSWNFSINDGEYFSYKECLADFMKHFSIPYKAAAYRSLKEALQELDLDIQHPKTMNLIMDERKHRSTTTDFGRWFIAHHGSATGENRKKYCRLYMQWKAGKINLEP